MDVTFDGQPPALLRRRAVHLLDADPDLGEGLDTEARTAAGRYLVVEVEQLPPGPWAVSMGGGEGLLGLLVLEGIMTRQLRLESRTVTELLGPGDVLRPWHHDEVHPEIEVGWRAHEPVSLAVLDRRLMLVAAKWPVLGEALFDRALRRARTLAVNLAVTQLVGIDRRLLLLFWDCAERWGRVAPDGVHVSLPLTQRTLAEIVGARRPTVSIALGELTKRGELARSGDDWILKGERVAA